MMRTGLWLGVLALALQSAVAQVTVDVVLDQQQFLVGEAVPMAVRVTNRSGETLHLGETADWLSIWVEGNRDFVVDKIDEVPVVGPFDLGSSQVAIKRLDLAPHFNLRRPGHYAITATVRIKAWGAEFSSKATSFDVIKGITLWAEEVGVPRPGTAEPEVRKYALLQARYLRNLQLYVRVTDAAESKIFRLSTLGPMVSFGAPDAQVDKTSNLHVLFQTGARGFRYCVLDPAGKIIQRQVYDYTATRPRLALDEAHNIVVTGGVRRETATDIPIPAQFESLTNDLPRPKP